MRYRTLPLAFALQVVDLLHLNTLHTWATHRGQVHPISSYFYIKSPAEEMSVNVSCKETFLTEILHQQSEEPCKTQSRETSAHICAGCLTLLLPWTSVNSELTGVLIPFIIPLLPFQHNSRKRTLVRVDCVKSRSQFIKLEVLQTPFLYKNRNSSGLNAALGKC